MRLKLLKNLNGGRRVSVAFSGAAFLILVLALVMGITASASAVTVQDVVNKVSQTSYQSYLNALPTHRYNNRSVGGAQHDQTGDTIYNELKKVGLNPYVDPYSYRDDSGITYDGVNVVAVKQGTTRPNDIYVIGCHYDTTVRSGQNPAYAPGADDNGSGVAAMLEIAKVMSAYTFGATMVFAAFDGEEIDATVNGRTVARLGSTHYVSDHMNDNVKGMISVDMIGWNVSGSFYNTADVEGRLETSSIRNALKSSIITYGGLSADLRTYSNGGSNQGDWSDHVAFADRGWQACMLIEDNWWNNPNYHRNGDYVENPGYINWGYATKMTKSTLGYFATAAGVTGVVPEPGSLLALGSGLGFVLLYVRRRRSI